MLIEWNKNSRNKLQRALDSYQEEDLAVLRERWSKLLDKRREYLNSQIQQYINKLDKTEVCGILMTKPFLQISF